MTEVRRILVKYGGAAIAEPELRRRLMADLLPLHRAGHRLVVVHGGGPQMTAVAKQMGIEPIFRGGRRVTDAAMLSVVQMVLAGRVNTDLMASALAVGLPALATCAASAGFVTAVKRPPRVVPGWPEPVDFGLVADIERVNPAPLEALWSAGLVPMMSSLVADADGQLLNLNADTLVRSIALAVPLTDLVYVADVPGVFGDLNDPASHLPKIAADEIGGLIASGSVKGGMIAKLDEIGQVVRATGLTAWIVGRDQPAPVSSVVSNGPGLRTAVDA
jgi:acetylglutamate kinase